MEEIYLEFLKELCIMLEQIEESWWSEKIKKSINMFYINKDVLYFLSLFGGEGSFNDIILKSEVSKILQTIAFNCATTIKNNENIDINNILLCEQKRLISYITQCETTQQTWYKKCEEIFNSKKLLDYINTIIDNYTPGNLHEITKNYLFSNKIQLS